MVENNVVISPKEGKIRGIKEKSHFSGTEFFSFYGVPYAQPPIGGLRFKLHLGNVSATVPNREKDVHKFHPHNYDVLVVQMGVFRQNMNKNLCKAFEGNIFMETIDGKIFPDSPRKFINSTERIPIIFGICHNESAIHFNQSSTLDKKYFRQSLWGWVFDLDDQQLDQMAKQVESFYCNNTDMNTASLSTKMDILTDAAFSDVYDTLLNVISADLPSSVYVYKFQYMAELGLTRNSISQVLNEPVEGTFHIDDLYHWAQFYEPKTRKTREVINTYTKLLTTFAKTGTPNYEGIEVQWKSTTPENPSYLEINKELSVIDGKLNNTGFEFWKNMKKQFKGDSI